jgi:NTP pyrophosphatase (non-canonical NTP hydrolase)
MIRTVEDIKNWGYDRGILRDGDASLESRLAQFTKTQEEVTELLVAIKNYDRAEAIDAIGDIIVTLVMQAELWGTNIEHCLDVAYEVISKRSGKMVNGVFVKEIK